MNALEIMPRGPAVSGPISPSLPSLDRFNPRNHKRRATDAGDRIDRRAPGADSAQSPPPGAERRRTQGSQADAGRSFPDTDGSLLIVQDTLEERPDLDTAPRLAGLRVFRAKNQDEAIQILRDKDFRIDLLLVIHHPSTSSSAAALVQKSLDLHPGLHVMMMVESGRRDDMRASYDAGAASIILRSTSTEAFTSFLRKSLLAARESQRQEQRQRERRERHASESPARRGLRAIKSWVGAPAGSRRKAGWTAALTCVAALLIGIGLASTLERFYRANDQLDAMANRVLQGISPSMGSRDAKDSAILRWQAFQQIGLTQEANEATRRYYQDHLEELRRQNYSRSSSPPEPVASPVLDPYKNPGTLDPTRIR